MSTMIRDILAWLFNRKSEVLTERRQIIIRGEKVTINGKEIKGWKASRIKRKATAVNKEMDRFGWAILPSRRKKAGRKIDKVFEAT